jgi:hypothetical protein
MTRRLTKRLLEAMSSAVTAMLAGEENQGDWPEDLPRRDLEDAELWIAQQLAKRQAGDGGP